MPAHADPVTASTLVATPEATPVTIDVPDNGTVSALLMSPDDAMACYVFAHGAGAGMQHSFMTAFAGELAARKVATLRYQFPYMERGSRRPDLPRVAHPAVRAAVETAGRLLDGVPLFAGGKSFGGRMTSQAQAASAMPGVRGLAFVGFPLHPAGKPSIARAEHLSQVRCPMLFLQGTRDELAELELLESVVQTLGPIATLQTYEDADHSFHVRASSGRNDVQVRAAMAAAMANWFANIA